MEPVTFSTQQGDFLTSFIDILSSIPWSSIWGNFAALSSMVGVVVAVYTLQRVKKLSLVQEKERQLVQELLSIDNVEQDYMDAIDFLEKQALSQTAVYSQLATRLGSIRGARGALKKFSENKNDNDAYLNSGFLDGTFLIEKINNATSNIDIVVGRAQLVSSYETSSALMNACNRGVKVRVVALSPDCSDDLLEESKHTVVNPAPDNAQDYRDEIETTTLLMKKQLVTWPPRARKNFQYRLSNHVPRLSVVRIDTNIHFGFLMMFRDAQFREAKDREYMTIPISSNTGKTILRHTDQLCKSSGYWLQCSDEGIDCYEVQIKAETKEKVVTELQT